MNSVAWLVRSLEIQNSNNADVQLDSGLNLFDIMANPGRQVIGMVKKIGK